MARLYRIAQEMRPGGADRWNGALYARYDDKWGGLRRDGSLRLNQNLVLDHLTGGEPSHDPHLQGQALATVLHESWHARVPVDAPNEPNAMRGAQSAGLDEGITEIGAVEDFQLFAEQAGYEGIPQPPPEYPGAVHAASALLGRATNSATERSDLIDAALDQPVVMRWDTIADRIVHNELSEVVPQDPAHQQAARAHLINNMAVQEWRGVQDREKGGPLVERLTNDGLDRAVAQVCEHYQDTPEAPFPAKVPNPAAAVAAETDQQGEQQRAITQSDRGSDADLSNLPPPDPSTLVSRDPQPAGQQQPAPEQPAATGIEGVRPAAHAAQPAAQASSRSRAETARAAQSTQQAGQGAAASTPQPAGEMRFLSGQAPAAQATHRRPSLGDGSRGASSSRGASQTHTRQTPQTTGRE
ncbi:hypothetical protein ACFPJ1_02950 [Kribbella qitaiheensis]|uniref:hypothetical protein n=1 Tax=Kribbella qitaiheensis TaxID=1544730 RepID=UPI00362081C3